MSGNIVEINEEKIKDHLGQFVKNTVEGWEIYSRRMGIVEPVFGNIRCCKGLDRFTLRTREKVNVQWVLYTIVHNIEKITKYGLLDGV